jgi:hypothetical protein
MSSLQEQPNVTEKPEFNSLINLKKLSLEDKKEVKTIFQSEQNQPNKRRKIM